MESYLNGMKEEGAGDVLKMIKEYIESELRFKQELITRQQLEIGLLHKEEEEYLERVRELEQKLGKSLEQNEGNKQLINKLLGDISKLQNDIDWYKRTFEKRSLAGVLKEKIFRKTEKKKNPPK